MSLFIDTHEYANRSRQHSTPFPYIPPIPSLSPTRVSLQYADMWFTGVHHDPSNPTPIIVAIELKSLSDLLSSTTSARLTTYQIPGACATYTYVYLLYYGEYKCSGRHTRKLMIPRPGGKWGAQPHGDHRAQSYLYLEDTLLQLQLLGQPGQVRIKHLPDREQTAQYIHTLHRYHNLPPNKQTNRIDAVRYHSPSDLQPSRSHIPLSARLTPSQLRMLGILAQFSNINSKRALDIISQFDTVRDMVTWMGDSEVEDWSGVKGIGKVIAGSLVQELDE